MSMVIDKNYWLQIKHRSLITTIHWHRRLPKIPPDHPQNARIPLNMPPLHTVFRVILLKAITLMSRL
jgi:hypothetical protein